MKLTRHRPDFVLFVVVVLLTLIGLVSIFSASSIIAHRALSPASDAGEDNADAA